MTPEQLAQDLFEASKVVGWRPPATTWATLSDYERKLLLALAEVVLDRERRRLRAR